MKYRTLPKILNQTGVYLRGRAEFAEAKVHLRRAFTLAEKVYGPDHPKVAIRVNNLGSVLQDMGDLQKAKEHYERALEICHKFLGEEHPSTAMVRDNLKSLANVQRKGEP